ncbi:branched-chain amino acid ABC transporter permease [Desulfosporosinus sp.]|uniref:branched-chain amino acid ABC transporter permease n=1 Tax=Desulfosporosinus sp. TaxID=157907 RepID=UPI0025BB3E35|nr:branched-chain amino acid ABC transporter permease [Desulfosporosinus sp.]MBC2727090.1 branched-chain amino acid ABC transporter permease [Desulfosporosinus sp.]
MISEKSLETGFVKNLKHNLGNFGLSPVAIGLFVLLGFAPYLIGDEYILRLLVISLLFGTLAMGFDLSAGYIDVANWGYAGLMGLGAYTSALLLTNLGISPWIGTLAGAFMAAIFGLLIGVLTLKMDGMFAAILAWFIGLILMALTTSLTGLTRGALGLNVDLYFNTGWSKPYFYVIFVICIVTYIVLRRVTNSNLGLAFSALGQDAEAARTCGVDPMKYKVINFTISCFVAGLCGGFYAHFMGILTPDIMSTKHTVEVLVIAYIGGRRSIWGPLLAAFLVVPVFEYLNFLMEFKYVIYGLLLILVMIFYPGGIAHFYNYIVGIFNEKKRKLTGPESNPFA